MSSEDEKAGIEKECDDFSRCNWAALAAAAWRHYLNYGRGTLLIDFATLDRWKAGEAFTLGTPYVTTMGNDDFESLILKYDPESQILIAFTGDPNAVKSIAFTDDPVEKAKPGLGNLAVGSRLVVRIYTASGSSLTPPEAHRQTIN